MCDTCVTTNSNSSEYTRSSTNTVAGYSTLGNYYKRMKGTVMAAPVPASTVVIPSFGGNGYNVLQHGMCNDSCGDGYFTLCNAYPNSGCSKKGGACCPGNCGTFTSAGCH